MLINDRDLGATSNPWLKPVSGQLRGELMIEGVEDIAYPRGSVLREIDSEVWVHAWQSVGGQPAGSFLSARYFMKQLEQLASNRSMNPALVLWSTTAEPGAYSAADPHDGWWEIDDFTPDYLSFLPSGYVKVHLKATWVAATAPRRMGMAYVGGALPTNFSGAALNLLSLPVGSSAMDAVFNRVGAEGNIPCILSPAAPSPEPVVLSATPANIFKGGVHVYDTLNTGTNQVPTAGLFVNANWVEVFGTDHDFVGDCVLTNGFLLLLFQAGALGVQVYFWNTALAVAAWQLYANPLGYLDTGFGGGTIRSYSPERIGAEEASLTVVFQSATPNGALLAFRLQRGVPVVRIDPRPLTQPTWLSGSNATGVLYMIPAVPKILYNSAKVADNALSEPNPSPANDYGFGAAIVTSVGAPIGGWVYENQPGTQPAIASNILILGDIGYRIAIIGDGPTHYYRLDDPFGTSANDFALSGAQNGVYVAAPTLGVAGALLADTDTAVSFNGTTQDVTIAGTAGFPTGAGPWSIEAWVKFAAVGDIAATQSIIASFGDGGVGHGCGQLYLKNVSSVISARATIGTNEAISAATLNAGTWYHIVATYDGSAVTVYVNGANSNAAAAEAGAVVQGNGRIAARNTSGSDTLWFKGTIDEVAFYTYNLTAAQVLAHYNAGAVAVPSQAQNSVRYYGFFVIPYGVSGSYSAANLQAEGESGSLGTGWSSVADGAASGGNTAKAASGTVAANADTFGTSFVPAPGTYDAKFRVRVTSAAGAAAEMTLGLWDVTASAFVASTTFKANQAGTIYSWLVAASAITPTAGHNMQFRAVTALTLGTDWFIDEAVLLPRTLTAQNNGPQDIAQQWLFDRDQELIPV